MTLVSRKFHPNGFVPISRLASNDLPWNASACACGSPKDVRSEKCRTCYRRPPETKVCTGCRLSFPLASFYFRRSGEILPRCKACVSVTTMTRDRNAVRRYAAKTRSKPGHYRRVAAYLMERERSDVQFRIARRLRDSLGAALRAAGVAKAASTKQLLGCSIAEFKTYIEALWLDGMTWENRGRYSDCWQIDHKRPVRSFDLTDAAQVAACFHFTNMQPLWALDNAAKGGEWDGFDPRRHGMKRTRGGRDARHDLPA